MSTWPAPPPSPPAGSGSHAVLAWALLLSGLLHLVLLAFARLPQAAMDRLFQDAPLEVVLVNARGTPPDRPQALAQAPLAGGGLQEGLALGTSPTAPARQAQDGDRLDEAQQKIRALAQQRMALLHALQQELTELQSESDRHPTDDLQQQSRQERRRLLTEQLARIEREQGAQQGPRRRHIGPATQEVAYALYYDRLRQRIESEGTRHFPQAQGSKLYGELIMAITLDHQGRVLATEVARSSGRPPLDEHATRIVRQAAPYGAFSEAMRQQADQIVVVTGFRFARDHSLHTRMLASPEGMK
ncbi:MAG: TonB family protein [Betaproteobacteria bacterium]|nr:TonB family protein [Betaproteobacteria bacterium]